MRGKEGENPLVLYNIWYMRVVSCEEGKRKRRKKADDAARMMMMMEIKEKEKKRLRHAQ